MSKSLTEYFEEYLLCKISETTKKLEIENRDLLILIDYKIYERSLKKSVFHYRSQYPSIYKNFGVTDMFFNDSPICNSLEYGGNDEDFRLQVRFINLKIF